VIVFQFRLQRVLELREKREQDTASRLAEARSEAHEAREAEAALEALRSESIERLAGAHSLGTPVGQLQNVSYMLDHLNRQIQEARSVTAAADETVRRLVEEFTAAFKERRVLDRLRDRQHEDWKANELSSDRQAMDAIAISRFARQDTSSTPQS
jgi:flagellar protein FliJ